MDLESAADDLYAGSPDEFVERRKALVAQARAAKDRTLANAIGKLRRPTRSAWLVNLYAREETGALTELLDLGAALQAAQAQLSGPELRRLSAQRQKVLAAATRRAAELGGAHGYPATEAVRLEITQTLQAALADPDVAEQVRTGTVTEAHTYGGFGLFGLPTAPSTEQAAGTQPGAPIEPDSPTPVEEVEHDDEDGRERAEAEQRLQDAESALNDAATEADDATAYADELADRVESLRAELAEAEAAEAEARKLARAARKKVSELEAAVRSAREAYEQL